MGWGNDRNDYDACFVEYRFDFFHYGSLLSFVTTTLRLTPTLISEKTQEELLYRTLRPLRR